jgi:hypothetical protein
LWPAVSSLSCHLLGRIFATSLKHKRQEINVAELIGTLDIEKRARAKDKGKGAETSSANMVQKKELICIP